MADAALSRVTNVRAARYDGVALTRFIDDALWARRKALNGCGCLLSAHCCKETREHDDDHSHIFPHGFMLLYAAIGLGEGVKI